MFSIQRVVTPPWPAALAGRLEKLTFASDLLRGNPLGDPHARPLQVYLPPGYRDESRRFPSVYLLPGYGGTAFSWAGQPTYGQPLLQLIDAAFRAGRAPEARVASLDGWTRYGGRSYRSQRERLDRSRRQSVRGIRGDRPLPLLPVRRGRPLHRHALPHHP